MLNVNIKMQGKCYLHIIRKLDIFNAKNDILIFLIKNNYASEMFI